MSKNFTTTNLTIDDPGNIVPPVLYLNSKENDGVYTPLVISSTDAYELIQILTSWIKELSEKKCKELQQEINKKTELKETIFQDAVDCQRFIKDLELLKVPLTLLNLTKLTKYSEEE